MFIKVALPTVLLTNSSSSVSGNMGFKTSNVGRRLWSIKATSTFKNRFYLEAVRVVNSASWASEIEIIRHLYLLLMSFNFRVKKKQNVCECANLDYIDFFVIIFWGEFNARRMSWGYFSFVCFCIIWPLIWVELFVFMRVKSYSVQQEPAKKITSLIYLLNKCWVF